jgi:sugar phosphate isomerase/epimerase
LAAAVGTDILGGGAGLLFTDRQAAVDILSEYDIRLAIENHPERTPAELMEKIGDGGGGRIGAAVDTGWFATQGFDAAVAIQHLGPAVFHVHLKDIVDPQPTEPPGVTMKSLGHETCAFGRGIVPLRECVRVLADLGYGGAFSIEHEPEDYDPTQDVLASLRLLQEWLASEGL